MSVEESNNCTYYKTGSIFESSIGYSRAVKKNNLIFVSGTTAIDYETNEIMFPGDAYNQTKYVISVIEEALTALGKVSTEATRIRVKLLNLCYCIGSKLSDVVRIRMFVGNIARDQNDIGKAISEMFKRKGIYPAATMVGDLKFVDEKMLVEIEADAVI
ncbi:hypothetical protein HK098_002178 [Nowakowskiella sp. JEL0407]|nr:hypothetical protein HK098_002178 [Nowakowskiella sp. JEL0407]